MLIVENPCIYRGCRTWGHDSSKFLVRGVAYLSQLPLSKQWLTRVGPLDCRSKFAGSFPEGILSLVCEDLNSGRYFIRTFPGPRLFLLYSSSFSIAEIKVWKLVNCLGTLSWSRSAVHRTPPRFAIYNAYTPKHL